MLILLEKNILILQIIKRKAKKQAITIMIISISDKETLSKVYSTYYKALVGYSFSLLEDIHESEDAVQNVFYKSCKRNLTFETESKLKSFLWTSVYNECITRMRHKRMSDTHKQQILKDNAPLMLDDDGEETLNKEELYRLLFIAIDELPARQREIFLLVMKGKKNAEIAEAMNISINTVRSQRKKGMATLRQKIELPVAALILLLS